MKLCESGGASAADMGVPDSKMEESIEARIQANLKTAQDPDGAVPSVSSRQVSGRSSWQDGFRTEVLPQCHSGSRFHSSWTVTRSIPVGTVSSWTTPSFSREENILCTEASYSFTATKGTCMDSSSTIDSDQGSVTRHKDVSRVGEQATMSALERQHVSADIKENQILISIIQIWCVRQQQIGWQVSSGLRGLWPRDRRNMCQVRVG